MLFTCRANSRLTEANSKLLNERSRSLITSSIANGSLGSPALDVGTLGSPANYGAPLGSLNRSLGLGLSLLSPVTDAQNSGVEDYLAKVCTVMNPARSHTHSLTEVYTSFLYFGPFSFPQHHGCQCCSCVTGDVLFKDVAFYRPVGVLLCFHHRGDVLFCETLHIKYFTL